MKPICMLLGIAALALSGTFLPAIAQDNYPSSPVRLIWGNPPGARGDLIARLLAQKLSVQMNANVFVENKPGASSNIAAELVARSKPDGYTVLFNPASVTLSPALGEKLGYDLLKDLAPVTLFASGPQVFILHPSLAPNTVPEFIAHLRANPGKLAYGSAGGTTLSHLAVLLFLQSNGLTALHVPYKGAALANTDLVAGRIDFSLADIGSALPLIKDKRLKALAITSLKRLPLMPDVPTLAETIPGFELSNWFGVMVPAKTPRAIVQRLHGDIAKVLQDPDMIARLLENAAFPMGSTPEEYETYLKGELERWNKAIRSAGVQAH